jgi:hypothetical protein
LVWSRIKSRAEESRTEVQHPIEEAEITNAKEENEEGLQSKPRKTPEPLRRPQ